VSTGYNHDEGNRRASRNGRVSDLPPEIPTVTIRNFCVLFAWQLRPNLVIMRYPDQWKKESWADRISTQFVSIVNDCYTAGKGLIMLKGLDNFPVESKVSAPVQ
jgi:hypothetical protein